MTILAVGCSGGGEPDLADTPEDVAADLIDEVVDVVEAADSGPADTSLAPPDSFDASETKTSSAPDVIEEIVVPTGPPEDLPEDKATWSCQVDVECDGCAGSGACVEGVCTYGGGGCVIADEDGPWASCVPNGESAPASTCLQCTDSVASDRWSGAWLSTGFETGLGPLTHQETLGSPGVTWEVSPARAFGGSFSAYFGDPELGTYASAGRSWGRISTPPIPTTHGVSGILSFWLWLDTEETPGFDQLRVLWLTSEEEHQLWNSDEIGGTTFGEWMFVEVDVQGPPGLATSVAIEFDTVDALINPLAGPYIEGLS
ncbi:MAG: hypothetical protein QF464_13555, partial [Myxococcota bacterium]|nr:hypothetical protein [Myxococcota bacterium]